MVNLTYISDFCSQCGCINKNSDDIIKWNWKRKCKIKITKACGYNALLILDKQRFICKHCNRAFTASTNVVDYHKQIFNDTNLSVKLEFMQRGLEKSIGEYRENLLKNPETINIKKIELINKDATNLLIIENYKIYKYSINNFKDVGYNNYYTKKFKKRN